MAGINYPLWVQLKTNIVTQLKAIATEETLVDAARNFKVYKDRWRMWIESQQNLSLVNVMVSNVGQNPEKSQHGGMSLDDISVVVDMYAIGKAGEVLPPDEVAADRIDLLTAQVREGLTRLKKYDFGFSKDPDQGFPIYHESDFALTYYDQETEQATGQYAPARWSFTVSMPFIPTDNNDYVNLDELNVSVSDETLELYKLKFNYTP
jgi:hypothetical protein